MAGANEQKLREHLASSRVWQVLSAESQWSQGAQALERVAKAIEDARPLARENLGRHTSDQADKAFAAMHQKVKQRQEQLKKGAEALGEAKGAISRGQAVLTGFDQDGDLTEPSPPDWSDDAIKQIQQLKVHGSKMTSYHNAVAAREEAAQAAIQDVDTTNQASTATMREIQGKPPLDTGGGGGSGTPGGGGGGGGPRTGTTPYDPPADPPTNPTYDPPTPPTDERPPTVDPPTGQPTYDPPTGEPPTGGAGGETGPGSPPVLTTPPTGTFGGMAGALGGGLAGGAIGMGAIRAGGALGGGATPASGARPIGSTARSGASGALGCGAAAGGTPTTRGAGAGTARGGAGAGAGAGRGAAGRGAGAGGAGGRGAGGRGAGAGGAGAGGRGRKGKDEQESQVDHLHDDQDWIDDEDAAPGVIG